MRTLTEKFRGIQEGKFTKAQFLRDARLEQPSLVTQYNSYDDAVSILKNRGLLFEVESTPIYRPTIVQAEDMFSIDTVERGIDVELEKIGVETPMIPDEEEYEKAKGNTLKNLLKNPNFYVDKLANVKSTGKRTDLMQAATKANTVDKANRISKVNLKEAQDFFAPGLDLQLVFKLHKEISNRLRQTGNTFKQEWPLASSFGFFANEVALGRIEEQEEVNKEGEQPRSISKVAKVQIKEAVKKLIYKALDTKPTVIKEGLSPYGDDSYIKKAKVKKNENIGREVNRVDLAKEALEDLLDPETLANPELMDQFLQNLRDEFMTTPDLFDDEEELAEMKTKTFKRRITSEGNIR